MCYFNILASHVKYAMFKHDGTAAVIVLATVHQACTRNFCFAAGGTEGAEQDGRLCTCSKSHTELLSLALFCIKAKCRDNFTFLPPEGPSVSVLQLKRGYPLVNIKFFQEAL